jgi:outer membrane protein OmpA-like peptidoglycan-associated protein
MLRSRIVIPLVLSSFASAPALGEFTPRACTISPTSARCELELERAFTRARNAEINASIAAVNAARAWQFISGTYCQTSNSATARCQAERTQELALARSYCKSSTSTTPRCEVERAREFAAARNAEIYAALAAVKAERTRALALNLTHCKGAGPMTPRCEAQQAREFAADRNAEINASMAAVATQRARSFAAARNAEINASMAAVAAVRTFDTARNAEIDASMATVAAVRTFEARRNAEIDDSMAAVATQRARSFAAARNAEINASMAKVATVRTFEAARNAEIDASMAAVAARRAREFAAARNAEINASIATVQADRALRLALESARQNGLETGAISLPDTFGPINTAPVVRKARQLGPCREAARIMSPLQFSEGSAAIEPAMKPELDRIAMMARDCPAIHIEIHGHSDSAAPSQINRHLAQLRAHAAVAYLVQSGVAQRRLTAIGHSDAQPLVPNTTAENRALNRRIEVSVNDPAMQAAAQRVIWDLAELLDPAYVPSVARLSP